MVDLSSKIANKESLGQNWGLSLSTVAGVGVAAGERSTVKSRSRGRAQGQLARRLVTDKLDAHRRLIEILSETVQTHSFFRSFVLSFCLSYFLVPFLASTFSLFRPSSFLYYHVKGIADIMTEHTHRTTVMWNHQRLLG